jgi:hypothetical protein
MSNQMTAAYAAGLIDGEGCISISVSPKKAGQIFYPRVDVGMSVKAMPVLQALMRRYGGTINHTRKQTDKWEAAAAWRIFGRPLEAFLIDIQPFLILKREQVEYALQMQRLIDSLPRRPNGSATWTAEGQRAAQVIRALVQEANRKGPTHTEAAGWFARHVGGAWITPQRDFTSPHGWAEFSTTWPRSGTMRNGTAYRLRPLAPLTAGTGSGLWQTPVADDSVNRASGKWNSRGEPKLSAQVKLWPTPTAHNAKEGGYPSEHLRNTPTLAAQAGGALNPTWVEWLMGFPLGWTDFTPSETP